MDPKQQPQPSPQQPQQADVIEVLDLTPQQQRILLAMLAQTGTNLLGMTFSDPDQDGLKLRQHAYMKGQFDNINDLLQYDARNRAMAEEKQRQAASGMPTGEPATPAQF